MVGRLCCLAKLLCGLQMTSGSPSPELFGVHLLRVLNQGCGGQCLSCH